MQTLNASAQLLLSDWRELREPVTRDVRLVVRQDDLDRPSVAALAGALDDAVDPGRSSDVQS